jgi:hypothetical protein
MPARDLPVATIGTPLAHLLAHVSPYSLLGSCAESVLAAEWSAETKTSANNLSS